TGARWALLSLADMGQKGTREERLAALVAATYERQSENRPVSEWDLARLDEGGGMRSSYLRLEQYMTTDLLTVDPDESVELVANLMDWHRIHHIPVENSDHRLVGLVSHRPLLRFLASEASDRTDGPIPVSRVLETELITGTPEMTTLEAIELMRHHRISSLPVVQGERLVGIITEHDFMRIASVLLEDLLRE
ncbi:MAG: CBS domain-containing protein, partial [Gemmatimonadota bacterium]|nr:CBS domain-containing protein [Gemmatimonadota bacterium]